MLDGNAFFGLSVDDKGDDTWYEEYLPLAWEVFKGCGGKNGWAGETSWMKIDPTRHENEAVKHAYEQWQLVKALSKPHSSSP